MSNGTSWNALEPKANTKICRRKQTNRFILSNRKINLPLNLNTGPIAGCLPNTVETLCRAPADRHETTSCRRNTRYMCSYVREIHSKNQKVRSINVKYLNTFIGFSITWKYTVIQRVSDNLFFSARTYPHTPTHRELNFKHRMIQTVGIPSPT